MAYAVFPGEKCYHIVKAKAYYTLCGLRTIRRNRGEGEYHPPARVTVKPPSALYRSCHKCLVTLNSSKKENRT